MPADNKDKHMVDRYDSTGRMDSMANGKWVEGDEYDRLDEECILLRKIKDVMVRQRDGGRLTVCGDALGLLGDYEKKYGVSRQRLCFECAGRGRVRGRSGEVSCRRCKGSGLEVAPLRVKKE